MNILQVNTLDFAGGAEKVAFDLLNGYKELGHDSFLAVGYKRLDHPSIIEVSPVQKTYLNRISKRLAKKILQFDNKLLFSNFIYYLEVLADGYSGVTKELGLENFHFPKWKTFFDSKVQTTDILQLHNLHGDFFDLRLLKQLHHKIPVILTLHDAWLLSGHCAHSFECNRWQSGCGKCPDLNIYPAIKRDSTSYNWKKKKKIFDRSKFYLSTPSHWLMEKVNHSMIFPGVLEAKVIPNGVDLQLFVPGDQKMARSFIGIPEDSFAILVVGNALNDNPFKDFKTAKCVVFELGANLPNEKIILMVLGTYGETQQFGNVTIRYLGKERDSTKLPVYYQAANVLLHTARADTFPNVIIESQACGVPVLASNVGGISEQIIDGVTGFLAPAMDVDFFVKKLLELFHFQLYHRMGNAGVEFVHKHFNFDKQVLTYVEWFEDILKRDRIKFDNY